MDSVREGDGGKIWENGIETCKISCMKRDASPGSMHDTGCLGLVHWDNPEGWNGEGGGRRVQDGAPALAGGLATISSTWKAPVRSLHTAIREYPRSPQPERSLSSNEGPAQPKLNK